MSRTIVTQVKTYSIDSHGKQNVFSQTQSTRVNDEDIMRNETFTVSLVESKTITPITKLFSLRTWSPVRLSMTQTGEGADPEPEVPTLPDNVTGVIAANNIVAGQALVVRVTDSDIPVLTPSINVIVYNIATGETEQLTLSKLSAGIYQGTLSTLFEAARGIDYDGTMQCGHLQTLKIIYQDAAASSGNYQSVFKTITCHSPYVNSVLNVNAFLYPGKPIAILVNDSDLSGNMFHPCVVENITTGEIEQVLLVETTPGTFTASIPTVPMINSVFTTGDNTIEVNVNDIIRVTVEDLLSLNNPIATATCEVRPSAYTNGIIVLPEHITVNSTAPITFFDYDLAGSGYIDIAVNNSRTNEFEYIRCTETAVGSGTFRGTLTLSDIPPANNDGVLSVIVGDTVEAVYIDSNPASGPTQTITASSDVVPAIAPEDEEPEEPDEPIPVDPDDPDSFVPQTISFLVDGLFVCSGNFVGEITISAIDKAVRCELTYV